MVDAAERAHFERIAAAQREIESERLPEELARPSMERLIEGLALGDAVRTSPIVERTLDQRALAQAELHRRARLLGLIR
jgi:hypothetical protein